MMKIRKLLLSVCLSISFILGSFAPCITVHAEGLWSALQNYNYFNGHFYKIERQLDGIIWNIDDLQSDFYDYLGDHSQSLNISNNDYQSWIGNNMTSDGTDISFSSTLRQALRDWSETYIEANCGYKYGYTYLSSALQSYFGSQEAFNHFLSLVETYDDYYIFMIRDGGADQLFIIDPSEVDIVNFAYNSSYNTYEGKFYKNGTNSIPVASIYKYFRWSTSAGNYVEQNLQNSSYTFTFNIRKTSATPNNYGIGQNFIVSLNSKELKLYNSVNAISNNGIAPYYIASNYNNTISGSYNTTINNIDNSITANDVNTYINNYYEEHDRYPTPSEITIHIEIWVPGPTPTPDPNPNPTPTPDPNPGPGGDDDDDNNIWDWLKDIGDVIGNLIAALGEVLAGLISAIGSIITSLKDGIPNTIGLFLEWFFPFLPTEIVALIELSILCMVIVGVIRIIRGH